MRKLYIAGNWKMNMVPSKAVEFVKALRKEAEDAKVRVMVAPSFVCLPAVAQVLKGSNITVAAQNLNDHESGAFTGEVSCEMLQDIGVNAVILGHSERRAYYGESSAFINKKVLLALEHGMEVVLCVGETLEEREGGKLEAVLTEQVLVGLEGVPAEKMKDITIAYEPVWAIGTGRTASPEDADGAHAFIRGLLAKKYGKDVAEKSIIQYGGSVKPDNVRELMAKENIDGALVGGASLVLDKFLPIVHCI